MFGLFGDKFAKIEKLAGKNGVAKLKALLNNKDLGIVKAAIEALGKCTGEDAFNALTSILTHPDSEIRVAVANALANLGVSKGRSMLERQAENETDGTVKKALLDAAHKIKSVN